MSSQAGIGADTQTNSLEMFAFDLFLFGIKVVTVFALNYCLHKFCFLFLL